MILDKIESVALDAPFAIKRDDIETGDMVTILADVKRQPDSFKPGKFQTIVKILTKNGDRYISLNQTSINILITIFGTNDAARWVGKKAKIIIKPTIIAGKKTLVVYLVGQYWELDEFGSPVDKSLEQPAQKEELDTVQLNDELEF